MGFTELPLEKAFMLFEPGPVILVATSDGGKKNLMTITWHMVTDFTPSLAMTTGPWNHSFRALMKTKECVLAVPTVDIAETVIRIGDCSGANVDKFREFGLTPLPAAEVSAPLVAECLANFECRLIDATLARKFGFLVLKVVRAWVNPARKEQRTFHAHGDGTFAVDGRILNLKKRMTKWNEYV